MIKQKLAQLMSVCNEAGNAPKADDKQVREAGNLMKEIEDMAEKEPGQIWNILRSGSNAEFCALLPMVQSLGSKFKGSDNSKDAAGELQEIAKERGLSNMLGTALGALGGGNAGGGLGAIGGLLGGGGGSGSPLAKLQSIKQLTQSR